ncbi:hypothetical protein GYMLUDRAFT_57671 [Collybiopsis luxurians FD-317 M1]|uniref:Mannose-6-phosphate isomerase n=1 Tax=Collybiopsis luxurians FD-317 M1 TaxID=944289 RepID=A0A0D0CV46_9AGAR|nr:hypothetical protein GYMLUDRAFT_57671 [Collybiopsis luxurians FD-317 M1]
MAELVFQLSGSCNNYPWGKKGKESLAAKLCAQTPGTDFEINDEEVYSEMWFGDYPDYPARRLSDGQLLKDVLEADKERLLGKKVIEELDGQLPYLPKILSIAKALPLQIHPNKELAAEFHRKDPENFTDPNHKPEIAVALSKFEVFAGFKPLDKVELLFKVGPLQRFGPKEGSSWTNETLRNVTRNMLKADRETVQAVQREFSQVPKEALGDAAYILDLIPRLQDQYGPNDSGILVALYCMNYLVFDAGDAIYIPADGIHAYLSGDIVERMARSNNVLNVGFCPPADRNNIDLFAQTLTFKAHSRDDVYLPGRKTEKGRHGRTVAYRPPMSEFDMLKSDLAAGEYEEILPSDGPTVLIVTSGAGTMMADGKRFELEEGFIFFIAPGIDMKWETENGLQIHATVV